MVKGTTPTFCFALPFNTSSISYIQAVFVQNNDCILTVEDDRMTFDGYNVKFTLEEWETLSFAPNEPAEIQLSVSTYDGQVLVSDIRKTAVRKKYPEDIY